jgi:hypothetical protein
MERAVYDAGPLKKVGVGRVAFDEEFTAPTVWHSPHTYTYSLLSRLTRYRYQPSSSFSQDFGRRLPMPPDDHLQMFLLRTPIDDPYHVTDP